MQLLYSAMEEPWHNFFVISPFTNLGPKLDIALKAVHWPLQRWTFPAFGHVLVCNGEAFRMSCYKNNDEAMEDAGIMAIRCGYPVYVGKASLSLYGEILFRGIAIVKAMPAEKLYQLGTDAAEALIENIFKVKSLLDPADPANWNVIVRRMGDAMFAMSTPKELAATNKLRSFLDQNWPGMKIEERTRIILAATTEIRKVPMKFVGGINNVISVESKRVMEGRRRAAIKQFDLNIGVNLTHADNRAIAFQQKTSISWLTNEYGKRATSFEKKAKNIVKDGMERGLGRDDISNELLSQATKSMSGRSESYFRIYAGSLVNRARSRSELNAYNEAKIERYIISAVLDDTTTDFCRWADGKTLSVKSSLDVMDMAEKAGQSIEEMKFANPWVREREVGDAREMYVQYGTPSNLQTTRIATITETGVGTGGKGIYKDSIETSELSKLGIGPPPYHGHCRTTTIADVTSKFIAVPGPTLPSSPIRRPRRKPGAPKPKLGPATKPMTGEAGRRREAMRENFPLMRDKIDRLPEEYFQGDICAVDKFDAKKLRKLLSQNPKPVPRWEKMGGLYEHTEETQSAIRRQLRAMMQEYGMVAHNNITGGRLKAGRISFKDKFVDSKGKLKNILGCHDPKGLITINNNSRDGAIKALKRIEEGGKPSQWYVSSLKCFIHEEIHHCSPDKPWLYMNHSTKVLEEATTELAARRIATRITGVNTMYIGSYTSWINGLEKEVLKVLDWSKPTIRKVLADASIKMRGYTGKESIGTTTGYIRHFVKSIKLPSSQVAKVGKDKLRKKLLEHLDKALPEVF